MSCSFRSLGESSRRLSLKGWSIFIAWLMTVVFRETVEGPMMAAQMLQ